MVFEVDFVELGESLFAFLLTDGFACHGVANLRHFDVAGAVIEDFI